MQSTIIQILLITSAILIIIATIATLNSRRTVKRGLKVLSRNKDIIRGLSKDFISTSVINLDDGSSELISHIADFGMDISIINPNENHNTKTLLVAQSLVPPKEREHFIEFLSLEKIKKELQNKDVYFVDATFIINDEEHFYQFKIIKLDENQALIGIHCIDDLKYHERQERELLENEIIDRTIELKKRGDILSRINDETIAFIGSIIESRDNENCEHVNHVKVLSNILAKQVMETYPEYGLTEENVNIITSASALHDIGKIRVPDSILFKPGPLSPSERLEMQKHCNEGCNVIRIAPDDWGDAYRKMGIEISKYHHERYDGNGYPDGVFGEAIPISAQIVGIAECYDALTSDCVYRRAYPCETAYQMLINDECGVISDKMKHCLTLCKDIMQDYVFNSTTISFQTDVTPYVFEDALKGLKIMIVEDNKVNLQITKEILEKEGAIVFTAENGLDCMSKLSEIQTGMLDAILMDITMPIMDGLEATRLIRELDDPSGSNIPIIAMTSSVGDEYVKAALDAGMNAYLTKPVRITSLTKVLLENMRNSYKNVQQELTQVNILANTDALTGIKNTTAYMADIEKINEEIKTNKDLKLSVILCDVNGLKGINDKYGHDLGDMYIINSCKIICKIFSHSPVYRIGGDEFAVLVSGVDYENRKDLFYQLISHNLFSPSSLEIHKGKGAFSSGIADFDHSKDTSVSQITKRADIQLYKNKPQ